MMIPYSYFCIFSSAAKVQHTNSNSISAKDSHFSIPIRMIKVYGRQLHFAQTRERLKLGTESWTQYCNYRSAVNAVHYTVAV